MDRIIPVGVCGPAGSGKSTLADFMEAQFWAGHWVPPSIGWPVRERFAKPVRAMADALVEHGFAAEPDAPLPSSSAGKTHVYRVAGDVEVTGRRLMQIIGTEFGREVLGRLLGLGRDGRSVWIDLLEARVSSPSRQPRLPGVDGAAVRPVIIDDVRFVDELVWVLERGGVAVVLDVGDRALSDLHVSEALPSVAASRLRRFESHGHRLVGDDASAGFVLFGPVLGGALRSLGWRPAGPVPGLLAVVPSWSADSGAHARGRAALVDLVVGVAECEAADGAMRRLNLREGS